MNPRDIAGERKKNPKNKKSKNKNKLKLWKIVKESIFITDTIFWWNKSKIKQTDKTFMWIQVCTFGPFFLILNRNCFRILCQ